MKRLLICLIILIINFSAQSQHISGQWRGYFNSKGDIVLAIGDNTEYVLDIEIKGNKITGFSYSYFQDRKYYVICQLLGTYTKTTRTLKITEVSKVKGFTPPGWSDCLQTHLLTYEKKAGVEDLKGSWQTAPGQTGNCGSGVTTLTRRTLSKDLSTFNKAKKNTPFSAPAAKPKLPNLADKNKSTLPPSPQISNSSNGKSKSPVAAAPLKTILPPPPPVVKLMPQKIVPEVKKSPENLPVLSYGNFEKRGSELLKTIEISGDSFKVDLYDNGVVDGDSISLFYNGKMILGHKMLSEKAISLTLDATEKLTMNELIMYADNLGLYPPNTALMVVTDGDKRYEVRISSDLKKSGTIRFIHKNKKE